MSGALLWLMLVVVLAISGLSVWLLGTALTSHLRKRVPR